MTRRAALTAAGLALILGGCVAPSAGGSSSGGGNSSGGVGPGSDKTKPCEATFLPNGELTGITTGASIKATLWVRCTTPPTEHHLTLQIEVKRKSQWLNYGDPRAIDKIPPTIYQPMLVTAPCVPGTYRLHWTVTGSLRGEPFTGSAVGDGKDVHAHDCG